MKSITVEFIPHSEQRCSTIGDYFWDKDGNLTIRVSELGNWNHKVLVAIHELVEAVLCEDRGIKEPDIMAFDKAFEAKRAAGNDDEPGDDLAAPYRLEHRFAENIERLVAAELGVDWNEYDRALNDFWHGRS
jgi:hypothetical protein